MHFLVGALAVAALWSAQPIIHKHLLASLSAPTMMVLGTAVYAVCLAVFAALKWPEIRRDVATKLTRHHVFWIAVSSLAGGFAAQLLYYKLLAAHPASRVVPIVYAAPVFTMALAVLVFRERVPPRAALGALLVVAGIVLISLKDDGLKDPAATVNAP